MQRVHIEHRCERCKIIFSMEGDAQRELIAKMRVYAEISEKTKEVVLRMYRMGTTLHQCNDGGIGIGSMVGIIVIGKETKT